MKMFDSEKELINAPQVKFSPFEPDAIASANNQRN